MGILKSAKPLASLGSGLLARKGQARPAMRPQGFASMTGSPTPLEDLGWNDMGSDTAAGAAPVAVSVPPVLVERATLAREVAAAVPVCADETASENAARPAPPPPGISLATATRIGCESARQTKKGKAAFTLRLDVDRHLRLRLASAVSHRSAQALVADALDQFLTTMPEVEALIAQLPQTKVSQ